VALTGPPQPADSVLVQFWTALAAVKQLVRIGAYEYLQLPGGATFPHEGSNVTHRLLVRQCYKDLLALMSEYFSGYGRIFIVTGNPGACHKSLPVP
jgi:hypothetical protein